VTTAPEAAAAGKLMGLLDFDLVVLDVMMPGQDGFSFTRELRARSGDTGRTPVLLLTARDLSADRIEGLTAGADDYLAKPFEPQELLLRIEAILRRSAARPPVARTLQLGACAFDAERGELTREGAAIRLTEAEVELLRRLARAAHEAVDRMELARDTADATGRAVDVQVTRLRRKIEPDPKNPRYLQTVRGVGYRLAPD
jgi:two-component system phosphate regulon response regulator OmpR